MRKFESIIRIQKVENALNNNDLIHVSEKIDGANASFLVDEERKIHTFSRNNEVTYSNDLKGFNFWVENNIKPEELTKGYIYYGEWLIRHKIKYKEDAMKQFYLFDIYDTKTDMYLTPGKVKEIADGLNIKTPECFYYGEFKDEESIAKLVGKSNIADIGEGIVIRNITTGATVKWVNEKFAEIKVKKEHKQEDPKVIELLNMLLTENKVEKIIYKGKDDGAYPTLEKRNYGLIMKYVVENTIDDIFKEEADLIPDELKNDFVNKCKKAIPRMVQQLLVKVA